MAKDYYDILGVQKNASDDDIKRAFRKLAHQYHPDKTGGNDTKFKEINQAYQTLGDVEKRKKYDQFGAGYEQMGGGGGGFGGGGFNFNGANFDPRSWAGADMGDLGEMFGDMFGGGRARREPARGRHIEMDVTITFVESAFGVEKDVRVYKTMVCEDCGGGGAEKDSKRIECTQCRGSGQVRKIQQTILGNFQTAAICSKCDGKGSVPEKACHACHGNGIVKGERELRVQVPAGIADGEVLRMSGEGEAVSNGGRAGDLYLNIRVKSDPRFSRHAFDVHSKVGISVAIAALGGEISVETVDGAVDLKIPAGTQPGAAFRLRAKGIPHLRKAGRGDHIVEVAVRIPKKLSKEQRKALESWKDF